MRFNLLTLLPLLAQLSDASDETPFLRGLKADNALPGYEKAKEAKNKLKEVEGLTGVVGTGIGKDDGEDGTGKATVVVSVESQSDVAKVPKLIDGVKVKTVVSGRFVAFAPGGKKPGPPDGGGGGGGGGGGQCDISYDQGPQAWTWGASTLYGGVNGACTLGGTVYKNNDVQYALSNYHCYTQGNSGQDIVVPGGLDGPVAETIGLFDDLVSANLKWCTRTPQTWGDVYNYCPVNDADAAAVKVASAVTVLDTPCQYSAAGTATVSVGDTVQKVGRTTGHTSGTVGAIDYDTIIEYAAGKIAFFPNQIEVDGPKFSQPGDSGSTVQNSSGQTVGLLYAGSRTSTVINRIADVETALGLTIK